MFKPRIVGWSDKGRRWFCGSRGDCVKYCKRGRNRKNGGETKVLKEVGALKWWGGIPSQTMDPGIFRFVTLSLEISGKMKFLPWKFHKIVLHPLEFPRPKTKTYGNFTWFFLNYQWKFHIFFYWPLKFPHSIFWVPLETLPPPLFVFFCNSPINYNVTVLSPCNCTVALSSWPCAVAALKIYVAILICFVNKKGRLL